MMGIWNGMKLCCLTGLLACLTPGALTAQMTRITLKNGASFSGQLVLESPKHLDLELGDGRIRIEKSQILERQEVAPAKNTAGKKSPLLTELFQLRSPTKPARLLTPAEIESIFKTLTRKGRKDARVGYKAGNSATSLKDAPLPLGTPEHAVASFIRLVGQGHPVEALAQWVDVDKLLESTFPLQASSLTRYSRHKAVLTWSRILSMLLGDQKLMATMRTPGIEVRTVREQGNKSLVEISLAASGKHSQPTTHLLSLAGNRITDLGFLIGDVKQLAAKLAKQLARQGSWALGPLLEQTADNILAERRSQGGKADGTFPLDPLLTPRHRRPPQASLQGTEVISPANDYRLVIPMGWHKVAGLGPRRFTDLVISSQDAKAYVMVLVDDSEVALSALERAARANLAQASQVVSITGRKIVNTAAGEALRFTAEAVIQGTPLSYHYHLLATNKHAYQIICWTLKAAQQIHGQTLDRIIDSFDTLTQEEAARTGDATQSTPQGDLETRPAPNKGAAAAKGQRAAGPPRAKQNPPQRQKIPRPGPASRPSGN